MPILVSYRGHVYLEAPNSERARYLTTLHLRDNKDTYKLLLEHGVGTMRVGKEITECDSSDQ